MKVNLRPKTGEKRQKNNNLPNNNSNPNFTFDQLRNYVTELESLLKETLIENMKLKIIVDKKSQSLEKKYRQKNEETIKKYSMGLLYIDNIEKALSQKNLKSDSKPTVSDKKLIEFENNINEDNNDISNIKESYENKIDKLEDTLRKCNKEKEDLDNKYQNEFELMSSVIYNLGFVYWSMKSDYEDKLKQNKGWLEMERIKQYNGDY